MLKRQVDHAYREDFDHLMSSGLYEALVSEGLLVPHEDAGSEAAGKRSAYKILIPERIPFVSYPYEWCFGQLKDAALATLRIQSLALDHGMSLKDASAYNIQYRNGAPVMIDTLSFERYAEGSPWIAYGQFCRHFLAPIALMSTRDVRLGQMSRAFLDGIPLDLASELLPGRTKLRPALQIHLHAHAKSQLKHADKGVGRSDVKGRFSGNAFRGLLDSLKGAIESFDWDPSGSEWVDYYSEAEHYSTDALALKESLVRRHLERLQPEVVWDLGANTGMFSRLAVEAGASTVSFDIDPGAVEVHYRTSRRAGKDVLPLVLDLTNPSPGIGWANEERSTIFERGPVDTVLALALVHHLAITGNVPLAEVAGALSRIARSLIIEFVPKNDPKVQVLLASREDIFDDYTIEHFEEAFERSFQIEERDLVEGTDRTLYLMKIRRDRS